MLVVMRFTVGSSLVGPVGGVGNDGSVSLIKAEDADPALLESIMPIAAIRMSLRRRGCEDGKSIGRSVTLGIGKGDRSPNAVRSRRIRSPPIVLLSLKSWP